eukprot:TRINITY_DN1292_c1_g1_i1.p1 TRINITY_DN1292_c1_g1~~TRINITY_DN1292_c1_g1_i1.p1  ORF type:complete len:684 (+),score=129.51 TRINITY_DN1292_c1_g1_i1:91-2142(+)
MSMPSLLRGVVLVLVCLVEVMSQGTGSIVYMSKKGIFAVLVDGSQQVRTLYEYPAGEVHEDHCGLVVDTQLGIVLWAETVEQPVMEAILWKLPLNPAGGEAPKRVAAYTSSAARVYGLTIDEGTKTAYMTFFMSVGVEMLKLENYDTADNVALSKGSNTHSGRRVSGPVSGFSPVFANGEVYESGKENRNDYCDLLRVSPNLQPPVALVNPRALQWDQMCGPIVYSKLENLIYYAMGDDFNANHLVRTDPSGTVAAEELLNVDIPAFLHDRPAVFYTGASWPNMAPIGDAAGWLATNSVSDIFLWDLTNAGSPVKTTIYTAISSEGNIGPIVWAGDVPPVTDSPTQQPTAVPTEVPTAVPANASNSTTEVPTPVPNSNVTTEAPTPVPGSNVTAVPTAVPANSSNTSVTPIPVPVTTPIPATPSPGAIINTPSPAAPVPPAAPAPDKDEGVSLGMIIGICAGVIVLCILIALLLVCYKRKKDKEKMAARQAERDYRLQEARNLSAEKERENKEKAVSLIAVPAKEPKPPTPEPVEPEPVESDSESEKEIVKDNITVEEVTPPMAPTRNSLRHSLVYWNNDSETQSPIPTSRSSVGGFGSESGPATGSLHHRIIRMYEAYNPAKMDTIDTLRGKYGDEALLKTLIDKYGPEPGESGGAMSPHFRTSVARDSLTSPLLQAEHMTD